MLRFFGIVLQLVIRSYGAFFLAAGAVLLYWAGRGLLGYVGGSRTAPSDPVAGAAGLIAGVLGLWVGTRLLRGEMPTDGGPLRSDEEEIADAERAQAAHDRHLAQLRDLARTDLSSAETLHKFLAEDLVQLREAQRVFAKRGSDQLARQFAEDQLALEQELDALRAHVAQLRFRSGAA